MDGTFEQNSFWTDLLSFLFVAVFLILGSCSPKLESKKSFIFCSEGSPISFNPQLAGDGTSFDASSQPLYNRLIEFKPGSTDLMPSLAESWEYSNDGKSLTLKLRQDVAFHQTSYFKPTRNLNADDVLFSFQRMLNREHLFHKVNGGSYEYFKSIGMDKLITSIEKISDLEVRFNLAKPNSSFLANLAMDYASILSEEYAKQLTDFNKTSKIDNKPIGTGPFKFLKYKKNKKIEYLSHEKYFAGRSEIERLIFLITPDAGERVKRLQSGKCHLIKEPSPKFLPRLSTMKGVRLVKVQALNTAYIGFNLENKKLQNKKLRQAMSHALNRRSYIESVYLGRAVLAKSPLPPSIWGLGKGLPDLNYSVEKAKVLIEESGLEVPIQLSLWTLPVSRPYNPDGQKMGQMVKEDLRQIGIDLSLKTFSWPSFLERSRKGEHEMIEYGWSSDNGDPDNFLYTLLSCDGAKGKSNVSRFCHHKYDELVTKARFVFSKGVRKTLYEEALKVFREEMPWIPIAHSNVYRAMSDKVEGYVPRPLGTESFYGLRLSNWSKPIEEEN